MSSRAKRSEAKDLGNIKMNEHVDALEILRYALNDNKQRNSPLERGRGCVKHAMWMHSNTPLPLSRGELVDVFRFFATL